MFKKAKKKGKKSGKKKASAKKNPRRRVLHRRRRAARRNPLFVARSNPRRKIRRSRKARAHRRNPLFVANPRRKSRKGRKHHRRSARRNPLFVARNPGRAMLSELPLVGGLAQTVIGMISRIPVAGGFLSSSASLLVPAALGAVALEIPMRAQAMVASQAWIPAQFKDQKIYLLGSGALAGAGLAMLLQKAGKPEMAKAVGIAVASAAAGAAYWQYRVDQACDAAGVPTPGESAAAATGAAAGAETKPAAELAGLGALLTAGFGMAPAYDVEEGDFAGPSAYGVLLTGS